MISSYILFTTPTCPNCPAVKAFMAQQKLPGKVFDATTPEGQKEAVAYNIFSVPTVVFLNENNREASRANNILSIKRVLE